MNFRPSYLHRSLGFLILGSAVAFAQTGSDPAMTHPSSSDAAFVKEAAIGGMSEVELGQLAVQKASDPRVKQFGQRMIDDHTKANDALKAAAAQEGIALPTSTDKKDVAAFEKQAKAASSPVQKFAADTLPTLESHLQMIEGINGAAPKPAM